MSDWAVLDRADPAPGDVEGTRALGRRLLEQAGLVEHETARLRSLAGNAGELKLAGDYAAEYTSALTELPDDLSKLGVAYRGCGTALTRYADDLAGAQTRAGRALADGSAADVRYRAALRDLQLLLPPEQQGLAAGSVNLTPSAVETATVALDENTREQIRQAAGRARTADADLDQARALADQAAALRGDAEERAARGIGDALEDSGIKNKSWLQKAWDTVSKPFRSWDDFVSLCGKVALIAGTAALFISGPIGWALMAAALVASAAIFANDLMRYSKGEVGLGTLAFDALGLIPGGRGVVSLSRWGKGLGALGRALTRPGGFRTLASAAGKGLRNVTSAVPHALDVAKGIRGALKDPKLLGRALKCRFLGRDPIDMVSGEMVLQMTDFELPGLLPIVLERTYSSAYGVGRWFGPSWSSFLDQRLEVDAQGVCFAYTEAVLLTYPPLAPGESSLPDEGPRLRLTRRTDGHYSVTEPETGRTFWFAPPPNEVGVVLPLAGVSDRNGNRLDLGYHPATGWLAEIDHTGGYRIEVDCQEGRITEFRLAGRPGEPGVTLIRYGYDAPGRLTEVINSSGLPLRFGYDRHDRITSWTDRNGTWYRYTYDAAGRVIRTTGSAHCLDGEMRYDSENRVTVEVNSQGAETAYYFNEGWQVERVVDPLGRATLYEWDRYHHRRALIDPLGRRTEYRYTSEDQLTAVVLPDGRSTQFELNEFGQPIDVRQPDGSAWRRRYDAAGNLLEVTDPAGAVIRYAYGDRGRPSTVTDALGRVTRVATNEAGLVTEVVDPMGSTTALQMDAFGRVVSVTDPLGNTVRHEWTVEGRIAARILPDGTTERWRYDGEGNLVEYVDPLGLSSTIEYTAFDLPAVRTDALGRRAAFTYDTELRLTSVTDPRGLVWRYAYDPAGQLVQETDFDQRVLGYRHDAAGDLVERVNGLGESVILTRDELGRVVSRQVGGSTTHLAYDALGQLVRAVNPDAEVTFERDLLGRVLSETVNGRTLSSGYDATGRRTYRRTPTGAESQLQYDASGRPLVLDVSGHRLIFEHDRLGREISRRLSEDTVLQRSWDSVSQLIGQTISTVGAAAERVIARREYGYRADGFITSITDQGRGRRSYALDALGQVTAVNGDQGSEQYQYDGSGNVVAADWPQRPGLDAAVAAERPDARGARETIGSRISRAGRVHYTYDGQGRLIRRQATTLSGKKLVWQYTWDAEDRLRSCRSADGTLWEYGYDGVGRRLYKRSVSPGGQTSRQVGFVWDGLQLAERHIFSPDGQQAAVTTWVSHPETVETLGQREVIWSEGAPGPARFVPSVSDLNGAPMGFLASGELVPVAGRVSVWGGEAEEAGPRSGFAGQYPDDETGLHYHLIRSYDPDQGAFVSPDPLSLIPGLNPRHYSVNPLTVIDPLGLAPYPAAAAGGANSRIITLANGTTIDTSTIAKTVANTQYRHVIGHPDYGRPGHGLSYFTDVSHAQKVLDDFHSGAATVLGTKRNGDIVVKTSGVTGFNHNPGAGYLNQPTDVFFIKGTTNPSVVPYSPAYQPRP